jgi:hypothetical protein
MNFELPADLKAFVQLTEYLVRMGAKRRIDIAKQGIFFLQLEFAPQKVDDVTIRLSGRCLKLIDLHDTNVGSRNNVHDDCVENAVEDCESNEMTQGGEG